MHLTKNPYAIRIYNLQTSNLDPSISARTSIHRPRSRPRTLLWNIHPGGRVISAVGCSSIQHYHSMAGARFILCTRILCLNLQPKLCRGRDKSGSRELGCVLDPLDAETTVDLYTDNVHHCSGVSFEYINKHRARLEHAGEPSYPPSSSCIDFKLFSMAHGPVIDKLGPSLSNI